MKPKQSFHFFKLEDRVLLDAGPMPDGEAVDGGGEGDGFEPSPQEQAALQRWIDGPDGQASDDSNRPAAGERDDAPDETPPEPTVETRTELIYVDAGVQDSQTLIDGLRTDPGIQYVVVHLDANVDGIGSITADLAGRSGIDAIHLLSHGDGDSLRLGNLDVSIDNIAADAGNVARWAASLDTGADLLIYGCDLASTDDGRDLIEFLAAACDCDVAASDDATGHADLGGDWILEFTVGEVETDIAFGFMAQSSWRGLLDITSNLEVHLTLDDGAGTTADDETTNANDGNLIGSPAWTTGEVGGGLEVDYTDGDDYIEIPNSASLENIQENSYTLSAWFRPDSIPPGTGGDNDANYGILMKAGWHSGIHFNNEGRFVMDHTLTGNVTVSAESTSTFTAGQYYHVVGTVDRANGMVSLYVDGVLQGLNNFTPNTAAREYGTTPWRAGIALPGSPNFGWAADGAIDEVRIYSSALSSSDVTELHAYSGAPDVVTGLLLHNTFDADASDSSGNNYDGVLVGNASIDTTSGTNQIGGGKVQLDGSDDFVDLSAHVSNFDNLAEGTISSWVYIDNLTGPRVIIEASDSGDSDSRLAVGTDGDEIIFYVTDGSTVFTQGTTASANLSLGTWHHIAVTVDGDGNHIYVDGVEESVNYVHGNASSNHFFDDVADLDFMGWGIDKFNGSSFGGDFDGFIDDGRVYNRALSSTDVAALAAYMPQTYTVVNTNDSGAGSLRDAIDQANANLGVDTIAFDIGTGVQTISLSVALPSITEAVIIDATTQGGYSTDPLIFVTDGGSIATGFHLDTGSDGTTITGIGVGGFDTQGLLIDSSGNTISNNYIGVDSTGLAANANEIGITLSGNSNRILDNVVSGNTDFGIELVDSDRNTIQGNYVGVDATGLTGLGNGDDGLRVSTGSANNLIGGDRTAGQGNVLSGNTGFQADGIEIIGVGADNNQVFGNYIGTNKDGSGEIANSRNGVVLWVGPDGTEIGGIGTGQGNIISGNADYGVYIGGDLVNGVTATTVVGNIIGLGEDGTTIIANGSTGLVNDDYATGTTIGGTTAAHRNVISGNTGGGISLQGVGTGGNFVYGNYIGTDKDGLLDRGNGTTGIGVNSGGNFIGGALTGQGNVIAANTDQGIWVASADAIGNTIDGNTIGLGANGSTELGNLGHGILVSGSASFTTIGSAAGGNVIAGSGADGIRVISGSSNIDIVNNLIGTDAGGSLDRGNTGRGIYLQDADQIDIEDNVISYNTGVGVSINTSTNVTLHGNYIGLNQAGNAAAFNVDSAITVSGASSSIQIGGSAMGDRNVIAADAVATPVNLFGIYGGTGVVIQGNYLGTDATGNNVIGGGGTVVAVNGADGVTIGGDAAGEGNIIGGSLYSAVHLSNATGTVIQGNWIGLGADGTSDIGNGYSGVQIETGALGTLIGGITGLAGNIITNNSGPGVASASASVTGHTIRRNSIYNNTGHGIDLGQDGIQANTAQEFPVLTSVLTNAESVVQVAGTISSTANTDVIVDIYANVDNTNTATHEGQTWIGSVTVTTDGSGNASFDTRIDTDLAGTDRVSATATAADGSTSEFTAQSAATVHDFAPDELRLTGGSGLSLNEVSGNDAYVVADHGGQILGGLGSTTVEIQYSTLKAGGGYPLGSYASAAEQNDFLVYVRQNGKLDLFVSGSMVTTTGSFDYRTLSDGQPQTISVTWDNGSGDWQVFVNGESKESGTGLAVGETFGGGGAFLVGQEQDSVEGNFNRTQTFNGTLHHLRVFDDVRSVSEVAASYAGELPYDEAGLVAQWNFDNVSVDGVIADSVSGNNLTIRHTDQPEFTADDPTLKLSVDENAFDRTVVGQVAGVDAERDGQIAALLAGDSNLRYSAESGKFYELSSASANWADADIAARASTLAGVSGGLVTIDSATENELVATFADQLGVIYLGLSDADVEGEFRWTDGRNEGVKVWRGDASGYRTGAYTNFEPGEPNDFGSNEDYIWISGSGLWNDVNGTTSIPSVIEYDADSVLDAMDALTYSIESQTIAGAFEIDADSGQIFVLDGSLLDYETNATHTLTIRTTDVSSNTYEETFTVSLSDLAESDNAPTDLSSGIELNTDGGNDAYLFNSDAGSFLAGRTSLTFETSFSSTSDGNPVPLLSYATSTSQNGLLLEVSSSGELNFVVENSANHLFSDINFYDTLLDGNEHTLSVSWDSTQGSVAIYVDGELIQTRDGVAAGSTISGGVGDGTLVFGQEQDAVGGGFQTSQVFDGNLYDVRLWDGVRSEPEISLNHQHKFDGGNLPSGLIANWQMDGFNGSNQVVDVVGGNNLSVGHATGAGFIASTPVEDLHVSEQAVDGATVGFVSPTDPETIQDVAIDGLFNQAAEPPVSPGYSTHQVASNPTFGGWTVDQGTAWLLGDYYDETPLGGRSVELHALNNSSISQTLTTEVGRQYQIVFAVSGDWPGTTESAVQQLRVSADGQSTDFAITEPGDWSRTDPKWQNRSATFTATDASTTLSFSSQSDGTSEFNVIFGDVRVVEIPSAVTDILNQDPTLTYDAGTGKFYRHVDHCGRL